jgi:hypothetical protein
LLLLQVLLQRLRLLLLLPVLLWRQRLLHVQTFCALPLQLLLLLLLLSVQK